MSEIEILDGTISVLEELLEMQVIRTKSKYQRVQCLVEELRGMLKDKIEDFQAAQKALEETRKKYTEDLDASDYCTPGELAETMKKIGYIWGDGMSFSSENPADSWKVEFSKKINEDMSQAQLERLESRRKTHRVVRGVEQRL